MRCLLVPSEDGTTEVVDAEPRCGYDFCDGCGDCLECQCEDLCVDSRDGSHHWVSYVEQVDYDRWKASGSQEDFDEMMGYNEER